MSSATMFVVSQVRVAPATVAARQVVSSATMFVVSEVRVAAAVVARPIRRAAVVLRPSSRSVARLVNSAAATPLPEPAVPAPASTDRAA